MAEILELEDVEAYVQAKDRIYAKNNEIYVNESGLHALIASTLKKKGKPFKTWMVNNVLPAIQQQK